MKQRYLYIIPLFLALLAIGSNVLGFLYGDPVTQQSFTMSNQWIENGSTGEWAKRVCLVIFVFLYAIQQAGRDARKIANHKKIRHGLSFALRVAYTYAFMLLFQINPILLIAAGGLFSFVFNQYLNDHRGKPLSYISDGNRYDTFFILFSAWFKRNFLYNRRVKIYQLMKVSFYLKSAVELIAASMLIWL